MFDVVTFGEAMIRLAPPHFQRLEQTSSLDVQVGGGELNVAVGASRLGLKSTWVSRLPKNTLGRLTENRVRQAGVDTSNLIWADGGRMGLYFVEFGAAPHLNIQRTRLLQALKMRRRQADHGLAKCHHIKHKKTSTSGD